MISYTYHTPSKGRPENMSKMFSLIPGLTVHVHENDIDEYYEAYPEGNYAVHNIDGHAKGLPAIRNDIMGRIRSKYTVWLDDDLEYLESRVWRRPKRYTDPEVIDRVVANSVQCLDDLGLSVWCWTKESSAVFYSNCKSFNFTYPINGAFILNTEKIRFDDQFHSSKADIDLTLQVLLEERVVICDRRFFFMFAPIGSNQGGAQMIRSSKTHELDLKRCQDKWKANFSTKASRTVQHDATSGNLSTRLSVIRNSPAAIR